MNALMPDSELHGPRRRPTDKWEGFAEIDRAIAEDRLTAYRWKKAWADPVARRITLGVSSVLLIGWSYLGGAGLGWW